MILLSLIFRHISLYTKNTCLYISTNYYAIYNILPVIVWWVLSNVSWTIQIYLVNHKIIASENYSY